MESVKAEERRAAGRRFGPEAVTEHDAGLIWETPVRTEATLPFPWMPPTAIQIHSLQAGPDKEPRTATAFTCLLFETTTLKCT